MKRKGWIVATLVGVLLGGVVARNAIKRDRAEVDQDAGPDEAGRKVTQLEAAEVIYDGKLGSGWDDWGWGPHELGRGSAKVSFDNFGGILLHHSELEGPYGALAFRYKVPAARREFMQVALRWGGAPDDSFQSVAVEQRHVAKLPDGWREVVIDWKELDPARRPFDRVMISSRVGGVTGMVELERIVLTKGTAGDERAASNAALRVICNAANHAIDPRIYGGSGDVWESGQSMRRIGGNPLTRSNWEIGAWNTGKDWFFENVGQKGNMFEGLAESASQRRQTALVVPTIGWVAKDTSSSGFPRAVFPQQQQFDHYRPEAGNGLRPDGKHITPGDPSVTSIPAPPELIEKWVRRLVDQDKAKNTRGVQVYILDNEPSLWNDTHRDVHPKPLGYDELLDRTIKYATAIRNADPDAIIAGPAEWGWLGYQASAVDREAGMQHKPDRKAHGDVPLVVWYLKQLAEHERKTGTRLLDVLDLHFYPAADGTYNNAKLDTAGSELRLRSTRALWDPSYVDESWIAEPIRLIPRMKEWVRDHYPGRKLMIGEWSFGADDHISGGLATAEALGRFGQQGLDLAFFWGPLKPDTPVFWAFRAFRDFDGKGGRFQDVSLPVKDTSKVSLFASRDQPGTRMVLVVVNREPATKVESKVTLSGCGRVTSSRLFSYGGRAKTLSAGQSQVTDSGVAATLEPFSLAVLDLTLDKD